MQERFFVVTDTLPLGHAFKCVIKWVNIGLFAVDCLVSRSFDEVCLQGAIEPIG